MQQISKLIAQVEKIKIKKITAANTAPAILTLILIPTPAINANHMYKLKRLKDLRYMTNWTEPSIQFTANHRRRSIKSLPSASPHQNLYI
jgi:hypothetical protein